MADQQPETTQPSGPDIVVEARRAPEAKPKEPPRLEKVFESVKRDLEPGSIWKPVYDEVKRNGSISVDDAAAMVSGKFGAAIDKLDAADGVPGDGKLDFGGANLDGIEKKLNGALKVPSGKALTREEQQAVATTRSEIIPEAKDSLRKSEPLDLASTREVLSADAFKEAFTALDQGRGNGDGRLNMKELNNLPGFAKISGGAATSLTEQQASGPSTAGASTPAPARNAAPVRH